MLSISLERKEIRRLPRTIGLRAPLEWPNATNSVVGAAAGSGPTQALVHGCATYAGSVTFAGSSAALTASSTRSSQMNSSLLLASFGMSS
jgi:hypothetical protein